MHGESHVRERRRQQGRADRQLRLVAVGCLLGIAVTHLIDIGHKFEEAPAIAALFVALVVAANLLALLFVVAKRLDGVWKLAILVAVAPFVGYIASRTVGLPQIEDHVGHWKDPVGTASLVFEAVLFGVALSATRVPVMRFASAAAFVAVGLTLGGFMLGQSEHSHTGHGGGGDAHGHDGGAGHAAGGGHDHEGMNIDTATPAQQSEARRLLVSTTDAVAPYRSYDAARAAGFGFTIRSFEGQKENDYWHLTKREYLDDGRDLDPKRPESLMYWNPKDGRKPVLVAVVFRVPTAQPNPELGGPIIQWHAHRSDRGGFGKYKMTHLWLLPRVRDAYSMSVPKRLSEQYGTPADGTGSGV